MNGEQYDKLLSAIAQTPPKSVTINWECVETPKIEEVIDEGHFNKVCVKAAPLTGDWRIYSAAVKGLQLTTQVFGSEYAAREWCKRHNFNLE